MALGRSEKPIPFPISISSKKINPFQFGSRLTAAGEYGFIRAFAMESEDSVSAILQRIRDPRSLQRMHMTCDQFAALPDATFKPTEPLKTVKRMLRCGTWVIDVSGVRNQDGTIIVSTYRACARIPAASRESGILHHSV